MREGLRMRASRTIPGILAGVAVALAALLAGPTQAQAQSNVVVLGVRSVEGDDEFTRNLTGAIRHAASQIDGWEISDREVTLAQMALAHGCADPDAACMAAIAGALQADYVIYGDVRRTSAGDDFDFSLNLHIFNAAEQQIAHSVAETIPGVRRDIDDLREPARRYIAALSGAPRTGTLSVSVNVPGAEVFIDGESAGVTDGEGHLTVSDIAAGSRNVRVVAEGHQSFRSTVTIEAYGEASFEAELEQGAGGGGGVNLETILGVGLLAVAVGAAAVWIYSMVNIDFIIGKDEDNTAETGDDWGQARMEYPGASNFCSAHRDLYPTRRDGDMAISSMTGRSLGYINDLCDDYDLWLPLQFVFLGIGALAGGVGTYLLYAGLTADGGGDSAAGIDLRIVPSFGVDRGSISVVGTF